MERQRSFSHTDSKKQFNWPLQQMRQGAKNQNFQRFFIIVVCLNSHYQLPIRAGISRDKSL